MILRFCLYCQHVITLIVDLGEQLLLVLARVKIVHHANKSVASVLLHRHIQRRRDDHLVILFHFAVHSDVDFAVLPLDLRDLAVQAGRVLQMLVQGLPNELRALLPRPEINLDKVHASLEIEVLEHVGRRDLVKIAIAKGRERSDPDVLHQLDAVDLAELLERQRKVLQVGVYTADRLSFGTCCGEALITAFRHAPVAVDVVAFVFGLQKLAEFLELALHLEEARYFGDVLLGLEGLDDLAHAVLVIAVQLRAVMRDPAEFLHVVHGVVRRDAHDGAHLIAAAVVVRRPALAADTVILLKDRVILVAFLFQVHAGRQACGASADDTDFRVLVHIVLRYRIARIVINMMPRAGRKLRFNTCMA